MSILIVASLTQHSPPKNLNQLTKANKLKFLHFFPSTFYDPMRRLLKALRKKGRQRACVRQMAGHLTLSLLRTQGSGTSPQLHRGVQSARPGGHGSQSPAAERGQWQLGS